jgi:uncharacterized linocin/CFP29 family protein
VARGIVKATIIDEIIRPHWRRQGLSVGQPIVAWVKPADPKPTQGSPARIVTLSPDTSNRNFTRGRGLVRTEDLGTIVSQYNKVSEMTPANESITGQAVGDRDRVEFQLAGVTVPIIFKEFIILTRQLRASRKMGNGVDTTTVAQAAKVVAEKQESHIIDGSTLQLNATSITQGLTNATNRKTDTAAGYGGEDWGTIANIVPTVAGMITALSNATNRYHGPYALLAATTQFNQASTSFYTDGSGETGLQRIMRMNHIESVEANDTLADGELVLAQLTEDVIDYVEEMPITVVEWVSPDGMIGHFKVMAAGAPRVKDDYDDRTGVAHCTGA